MAKTSQNNLSEIQKNRNLRPVKVSADDQPMLMDQPPDSEPPEIEEPPASEPQAETVAAEAPTPEPPALEVDPNKPRVGRPRRDDPPKPRSAIIDRINNLASWEGTRVYVYRHEPIVNELVGGKQTTSVKRFDGPFDEQDIMEDPGLGSGLYELIVNRTDPATRQRRMIDSGMVNILNMKFPPKLPKGGWIDDARNKSWEWARNITEKTDTPAPVVATDPNTTLLAPILAMLERQAQANQAEVQALRQMLMAKKDETSPLLAVLTPLLPILLQKLMQPGPDPMAGITAAIALLKESRPEAPPVTAPIVVDRLADLEKELDFQKKLQELTGGGGSGRSRKSAFQETITDLAESLGPILGPPLQMVAAGMMQNMQNQQHAAQPQPQQQPNAPGQELIPIVEAAPGKAGPQLVANPPTDQAIADAVLSHLRAGKDGFELGDWYLETYGEDEFQDIRVQGKPNLMADLRAIPNTWRFISEYVENKKLDQLLMEFFTWTPPDEEEEPEEPKKAQQKAAPVAGDAIQDGWTTPEPTPELQETR